MRGQMAAAYSRARTAAEIGAAVNTGLTSTNVRALAIDPVTPTTLYAGGSGVFKSTNGGGSWSKTACYSVRALALDPAAPDTLYVGSSGNGVYKSTDGGGSWSALSQTG